MARLKWRVTVFDAYLSSPWIIERLDRKLAVVIGSNRVKNCDVTLSRAIQLFVRVIFPRKRHCSRLQKIVYVLKEKDKEELEVKTTEDYKTVSKGRRGGK